MGYETFLPVYLKTKKKAKKEIPLFPRYLFINFDPEKDPWRSIRNCRGVAKLISFNPDGLPASIPEEFIDAAKLRLDRDGYVKLDNLPPKFCSGDRVEIVDGPFADYEGIFLQGLEGKDRVLILLNILSSGVKLSLPSDLVRKI